MAPKLKLIKAKKARANPVQKAQARKNAAVKKEPAIKNEAVDKPAGQNHGSTSDNSKIEELRGIDAKWLLAGSLPLDQRVNVMEDARIKSRRFLRSMETHLKNHNFSLPGFSGIDVEVLLSEIGMGCSSPFHIFSNLANVFMRR